MAESEGFEPPVPCGTFAFQANTIGHSVNSPLAKVRGYVAQLQLDVKPDSGGNLARPTRMNALAEL